jgi:hypothetical protein
MWSTDHKMIAMQYLFTGMGMALIGAFMVYVFRMQLAFPGISVPGFGHVSPNEYNALITNHGAIMIFWVAMPVLIAAFGNYLIPLMVGCDDMVFPAHQSAFVPNLPAERDRAHVFVLRRRRRLWWCLDRVSPPLGQGTVQLDAHGRDAVGDSRRPRVRGLFVGRHQLHHDGDEFARSGDEDVRHPDRGVDDRHSEHPVHGFGGPPGGRRSHVGVRSDYRDWLLRPQPWR